MSRLPHATGCRVERGRDCWGMHFLRVTDGDTMVGFQLRGNALWAWESLPCRASGNMARPTDASLKALVRAAIAGEHPAALLDYLAENPERCPGVSAEAVAALHREGF